MTNREWLNTLSDEEYYTEIENITDKCDWCPEYVDGKMTCKDEMCKINAIKYLQAEHETTADEDFVEIGFINKHEFTTTIQYTDNEGRLFFMAKCGTNSYSNMDGENADWTDDLIDKIRTIADKKRKEMGWK